MLGCSLLPRNAASELQSIFAIDQKRVDQDSDGEQTDGIAGKDKIQPQLPTCSIIPFETDPSPSDLLSAMANDAQAIGGAWHRLFYVESESKPPMHSDLSTIPVRFIHFDNKAYKAVLLVLKGMRQ